MSEDSSSLTPLQLEDLRAHQEALQRLQHDHPRDVIVKNTPEASPAILNPVDAAKGRWRWQPKRRAGRARQRELEGRK